VVALSAIPSGWPVGINVVVAVAAAAAMGVVVGLITGQTLPVMADASGARAGSVGVSAPNRSAPVLALKFAWTAISCFVVESAVFGLAALPATVFYQWHFALELGPRPLRLFLLAAAFIPAYAIFALLFMALSAETARLLGWRPPTTAELRIAELPKGLRNWARYSIMSHLVHVLVGVFFRSTPVWVWYMRRNGATIGKHVWVNSLQVGDDCLLDLGDEVVIGAGVHLSGHTVEHGMLRLAPVTLGAGTTVGLGTHVGIGVTTGPGVQIASMSVVPKHARLEADTTYAGIPVRPIDPPDHNPENQRP
ncbi:MAG: acyltransferase, partial [Acidimicrobiales bacterium]